MTYSNLERIHRWWRGLRDPATLVPDPVWSTLVDGELKRFALDAEELGRVRKLTGQFLRKKVINGAGGQQVGDYERSLIAATACLLILRLDISWYDGWVEVIVYPDEFIVQGRKIDQAGVVHEGPSIRSGESWGRGPVILSWRDIAARMEAEPDVEDDYNVILHEFAHKLDMQNGAANGMPPLHADMEPEEWTRTFEEAFERLQRQLERGEPTAIDPYGAEEPAEFFAVVSEQFFELPGVLKRFEPALYDQLRRFYRQDPASRALRIPASRANQG